MTPDTVFCCASTLTRSPQTSRISSGLSTISSAVFPTPCTRRIWPSTSFISSRGTILSTNPCSNKNSALWKPSGSFCPMVCWITLGPANPISAPGSAKITSPNMAKLAVTPPVVGSVRTLINSCPASWCRFSAALVFAICIREIHPSCILAPPEQAKMITGSFSSVARSTIRVIFSPTTCPMLLIINRASQTPMADFCPWILQLPVTMASFNLVFS